jgi:ketosteroid isomerase-like protein
VPRALCAFLFVAALVFVPTLVETVRTDARARADLAPGAIVEADLQVRPADANAALNEMVQTERRFAARAIAVGWKQAFLEYFADDAVGFDADRVVAAKELFRRQPDPAKSSTLMWEPRYGDIASSGDLGYLTGPVRRVAAGENGSQVRHSVYASVWKRQPDGAFNVIIDMGVPTPGPVPFADGFVRARRADVWTGRSTRDAYVQSLRDTDAALTNAARSGQADAYRGHLAESARFHRAEQMPVVGVDAILLWLQKQPAYASGSSRFADASASGDLGYTYGRYALRDNRGSAGFYVRVWTRGRDGVWRVALDVLQ